MSELAPNIIVQTGSATEKTVKEGHGRGKDVDPDSDTDDNKLPGLDNDPYIEDPQGYFQCHHGKNVRGF